MCGARRAARRGVASGDTRICAIETCLTLRTAYRLGLRQTQGLMDSIGTFMGLDIRVPDYSHTVASRKRLEHRSGGEASRVCGCPSGGGQYRPQDLRRGGMARAEGPCCMDHPEGCLIIVFFNTGDNLDAT